MPKLLHVQSSPSLTGSVTRELSNKFVDQWVASHANMEVDMIDLSADPLPHFGPAIMAGATTPPEEWSDETRDAMALTDRLINQVEAADVIVIGSPMINFSICSQLKAWIDHITIAGRTFDFVAPGISKGLLFGKKVFVVEARGGDYRDAPVNAFDFQEPLLRTQLGFLGLYDVTFIRAEGMRQNPDEADSIIKHAESVIARVAA